MTTKTVYLYDETTGEFKGAYDAQESPLEPGVYMAPICSTPSAPPAVAENQVAVFVSDTWSIQPDYRGQTIYDQSNGAAQEVTAIGPIPTGYALSLPPATTLANAKSDKKKAVKDYRDNLLLLTPFEAKQIQTDLSSKMQIMALAGQTTLPASAAEWRTADNTYLTMTLASYQSLYSTIMSREGAAFNNSAKHQDAIDALTDVASVEAYDYSTGWPT